MTTGVAAPMRLMRLGDQAGPLARRVVVCCPHAGGNASAFSGWAATLGQHGWSILAPSLPGRLDRLSANGPGTLAELATLVAAAVEQIDGQPEVAVLGHSFGAVVGFEVARKLAARGRPPQHLVLSGALPPHLDSRDRGALSAWDDERLVHHLFGMGGTPADVRGEIELERMLVSAFRLDIALLDGYLYTPSEPLPVPTTVFTGSADLGAPLTDVRRWQDLVVHPLRVNVLPGGHFFPWESPAFLPMLLEELDGNRQSIKEDPC